MKVSPYSNEYNGTSNELIQGCSLVEFFHLAKFFVFDETSQYRHSNLTDGTLRYGDYRSYIKCNCVHRCIIQLNHGADHNNVNITDQKVCKSAKQRIGPVHTHSFKQPAGLFTVWYRKRKPFFYNQVTNYTDRLSGVDGGKNQHEFPEGKPAEIMKNQQYDNE